MGKVGQYFSASEFACSCCKQSDQRWSPSQILVSVLDEVRKKLGVPLRISSGIRCLSHNKSVGGAPQSWHVPRDNVGYAADITYSDAAKRHGEHILRLYIEIENEARRRDVPFGLGLYSGWVHFDTRGEKGAKPARWFKYSWPR